MRGKHVLGALIVVLALLPLVAADFSVQVVTVEDTILPGQTAHFDLLITNELPDTADRYTISSREYSYISFVDERPVVEPGETETYTVEVSPRSFVNFGTHRVPLLIRSRDSGQSAQVSPVLFLQDPDRVQGQYAPSIALSVGSDQVIDPREDLRLLVHLRNRNARNYEGEDILTVRLFSEDLFYEEYQTSLGPVGAQGEKSTERVIELSDFLAPGDYPLTAEVVVGDDVVSQQRLSFTVQEYSLIDQDVLVDQSFFKTTTSFVLSNAGNVNTTAQAAYPAGSFAQLFSTASHNYDVQDVNGERSLVVSQVLAPEEQLVVTYVRNYRLLALLILLGILSGIGYYALRSPLVLGKEAEHIGDVDEGESEIKVRLFLKNRSSQTLRNLRVIDRISGMAQVQKNEVLGTLKPTKVVKKKGQGTLIRWDVDVLEPFEERIITYRVRTPLTLVGDVTLPSLKAKFDGRSGRERTVHSNEVSITRLDA